MKLEQRRQVDWTLGSQPAWTLYIAQQTPLMSSTKKAVFRKVRYWRITLGDDAAQWAAWRSGNFIALGWDELGDLSLLRRQEFDQRVKVILAHFPDRTKASAEQVWRFAHRIREGDRVVVARDSRTILAIGHVAGPYFFVPDVYKGHCLPVDWDDLTVRRVELPNWRRMLVELSSEQFAAVQNAPVVVAPDLSLTLHEAAAPYLLDGVDDPRPDYGHYYPDPTDQAVAASTIPDEPQPTYSLAELAATIGYAESEIERWVRALERKGQLIFFGPPGVGKTFVARALARHLVSASDGIVELVQFHPAYSYEDFVQGLRPYTLPGGQLGFRPEAGHFIDFCRRAALRQGRCVLIIDEINRANLARVFGELLYLLEYREDEIRLAAAKQPFQIPANVYLIGTMNSADRSIALVDHALRRRFAFVELTPNYTQLLNYHRAKPTATLAEALLPVLHKVNDAIGERAFAIGVAYFLRDDLATALADIWQFEIEPLLEEYFFDDPSRMADFRWRVIEAELADRLHS